MTFFKTILTSAAALGMMTGVAFAQPEKWDFDPSHTEITFAIGHFGFSHVLGRFDQFTGTLLLDEQDPTQSSVNVSIDTTTIDTGFALRDEHLQGAQWLNTAEYPTITFKSTKVDQTSETTAKVTGDLTLLGETHPVTLDVTLNKIANHPLMKGKRGAGFTATGMIKRSEFGLKTYVPNVSDEVTLHIETEVNQDLPKTAE